MVNIGLIFGIKHMINYMIFSLAVLAVVYIIYVIVPKVETETKCKILDSLTKFINAVDGSNLSDEDKEKLKKTITEKVLK